MDWTSNEDGDSLAPGWAIVNGYHGHALYRVDAEGESIGDPYRIGTLQECQDRAKEVEQYESNLRKMAERERVP